MAAQLGGHQISALLESLPGSASVLRSPVADAIVNMIRAGAAEDPDPAQTGTGGVQAEPTPHLLNIAVTRPPARGRGRRFPCRTSNGLPRL